MMTKKCNTILCVIAAVLFSPAAFLYGESGGSTSASSASSSAGWVIAAGKFSFSKNKTEDQSSAAIEELLPKLILEQLAQNLERMPAADEKLDTKQYSLQKKRLDLFLQLSKEIQVRDSLVISDYSARTLKAKIEEEDKKIADLRRQIQENLDQEAQETQKAAPDIEREKERERGIDEGKVVDDDRIRDEEKDDTMRFKEIVKGFVGGSQERPVSKAVSLYKDDFNQLFDPGKDVSAGGYDSREFEDAVISAGINGLLTGTITIYGEYVSASVSLVIYPGCKTAGTVTDVGSVSDIRGLAVSIARQMTPKITNSMPVRLDITVSPEEAADKVVITIDDVVYKKLPDNLIVESGIHSITFSSEGYKQLSTSYAFRGRRAFAISVEMIPENPGFVYLRLKKPLIGTMYANGEKSDAVDESSPVARIKINNQPVLGQFITEDGSAASFYIPLDLLQNEAMLAVNAKPFDRSKYIDTRRRWMYSSYSLLLISLMATFYSYGTYTAEAIAYKNSYVSYQEVINWQKAAQITSGISVGCGVLMIYELVRYFIAANSVLPANARPAEYDIPVPQEPADDAPADPGQEPVDKEAEEK